MTASRRALVCAVGAWLGVLSGCAGRDDETSARSDSQQKCDTLNEQWCAKVMGCIVDAGLLSVSEENAEVRGCIAQNREACDRAVDVSGTYDECLVDVAAASCEPIVASARASQTALLPASCMQVILIGE